MPFVVCLIVAALVLTRALPAQDPARWWVGGSVDVENIPGEFLGSCAATHREPIWGYAASLAYRPVSHVVIDARYHTMNRPTLVVCAGLPTVGLGGVFEDSLPPTSDAPAAPFGLGELRVAVETPQPLPLARVFVGFGVIRGSRDRGVGSFGAGIGTRGNGVRVSLGVVERVSRVTEMIDNPRFFVDTAAHTQTPLPPDVRRFVVHPRWASGELTIEIPLFYLRSLDRSLGRQYAGRRIKWIR